MMAAQARTINERIEWALMLLGVLFCLSQLIIGFDKPILDQYAFRQTQTAISTYWIMQGGAWLAYATPVLGSPWPIPLEFPLYQWIVAILASHSHFLTLDQAGRIVSEVFFLACLWPIWRIASHLGKGRSLFRICGALLLFSPLYVFWSRSFMMESTALFFSLWFVAALIDYLNAPGIFGPVETASSGALAACIKITTFVGFSFAGALIVAYVIYRQRDRIRDPKQILVYAVAALATALPVVALLAWTHYSDVLKLQNPIAKLFTSSSAQDWVFGSLKERTSPGIWRVILLRAPNEAFGSWMPVAVVTALMLFRPDRKQIAIYFSLLALYTAPFFVFTNLQLIHHYYQYANSIFLVFAIAYALYCIAQTHPRFFVAAIACIVSIDAYGYSQNFYADMMGTNREPQLLLASYVREHVPPEQTIVGFGLQWSSEVPYYGERRALLIPDAVNGKTPDEATLEAIAADPLQHTGGQAIGAVIVCPNELAENIKLKKSYGRLLDALTRNRSTDVVGDCLVYQ